MLLTKIKRTFLALVAVLFTGILLILILVYLQLSDLDRLKETVVAQLEDITGREISIGDAELDFIRGVGLKLERVSIGGVHERQPEFSAESVWVVIKIFPLLNQKVEIQKLIVKGSSLFLVRGPEGKMNFGDVQKWMAKPSDPGLFKVLNVSLSRQLVIEESKVTFQDHFRQPANEPLSFSIDDLFLSIRKGLLRPEFIFNLHGKIPGEFRSATFNASGSFEDPAIQGDILKVPFKGSFKVDEFHIPSFKPYFKKVAVIPKPGHWMSLESDFSGNLGGMMESAGVLKFYSHQDQNGPTLRDLASPYRGTLEYQVRMENDTAEFTRLEVQAGPFHSSLRGRLSAIKSDDPEIAFSLQTSPFKLNKSREYFPLMIFPEGFHKWMQGYFYRGTAEIKKLSFEGSLEQLINLSLEDSRDLIAAELNLKQVNWRSPLPPLKRVNGTVKFLGGVASGNITKARYKGFPITGSKGTIKTIEKETYYLHPTIAITPQCLCLGVMGAKVWQRGEKVTKKDQRLLPVSEKEILAGSKVIKPPVLFKLKVLRP